MRKCPLSSIRVASQNTHSNQLASRLNLTSGLLSNIGITNGNPSRESEDVTRGYLYLFVTTCGSRTWQVGLQLV